MKKLLRSYLFNLFALYATTYLIKGFTYTGGTQTILMAALIFTIITVFLKPVLELLTMPLNFLSLGLMSFVINIAMLYLLTLLLPQIHLSNWHFDGFSSFGFVIPAFNFTLFYTYALTSLSILIIVNFLNWLLHK